MLLQGRGHQVELEKHTNKQETKKSQDYEILKEIVQRIPTHHVLSPKFKKEMRSFKFIKLMRSVYNLASKLNSLQRELLHEQYLQDTLKLKCDKIGKLKDLKERKRKYAVQQEFLKIKSILFWDSSEEW